MSLVERKQHLAQLTELLADCLAGKGRMAVVSGPVGCGKTALLDEFTERATRAGARVLGATCARSERGLPLGVLDQLCHTILSPAELRGAAELIGAESEEAAEVLQRLTRALLELAEDAPVLVAVDDLQHADTASLGCLLYLVRRLRSARVLAVFTETPDPHGRPHPFDAELPHEEHCVWLELGPLSPHGLIRLLAERLEPRVVHRVAPDFLALAGGHPALTNALLDDSLAAPADWARLVVTPGASVGKALLRCLYRSDPATLDVARVIAVLGARWTPVEVGALTGLDPQAVDRILCAATEAGLLTDGHFRHPAHRAAVLADLSPTYRAHLHAKAAWQAHEAGAPAIDVAGHVMGANRLPPPWAVLVLREAAEHALGSGDTGLAVDYLDLARRGCASPRARAAIRARSVAVEWLINPAVAARRLTPLTAAARAGLMDGTDGIILVRQLLWHGRLAEAADTLDRVRRTTPADRPDILAELRDADLWLSCSFPILARTRPAPTGPAAGGLPAPLTLRADPCLRASAALADVLTLDQAESAAGRAEQILRTTRLTRRDPRSDSPARLALLTLLYADQLATAANWCDHLRAEAADQAAPTWQAMFAGIQAEIALRQGELPSAVEHAQAALAYLPAGGWGVAIGLPIGALVIAHSRMGRFDDAAALLDQPVPDEAFHGRYGLHYLFARGQYYLATGSHHAALADFLSCGRLMHQWGLDTPRLLPWRIGAAESWLAGGEPDQARRLVTDQLSRLGMGNARIKGSALRLLAATTTDARGRARLLFDAVELLEDGGDRYDLARALTDLGAAHHALGEHRRARTIRQRAWHVAREWGASSLLREMIGDRSDLRPAPAGSTGVASLTDAERRVAGLAAVGYTNRQIAGKLFITASTVEQHLTRVYRKLRVRSRTALPTKLHADIADSA